MKYSTKAFFSFVLLAIMFFANSCSFEMNKRRYNRGWDFGYSNKYSSVESQKMSKSKSAVDSIEIQDCIDEQILTIDVEPQNENNYNSNVLEHIYYTNDTLDSLIQPDTSDIEVKLVEDQITLDSEEVDSNDVEFKPKEKDYVYNLAIIFMAILALFSLFYVPFLFISYINFLFLNMINMRLLIVLSALFIGGKIISMVLLFRAGANLKKEKTYSEYKSKFDSLVSLSFFSMGLFITFIFALLFKRKKSEFPEEIPSKKRRVSKGLRLIVGLLIAMFLLTFLVGVFL